MSHKSITKDELFLVKLFELAQRLGDTYADVDRYAVGKPMSQNDKSVDNIVRMLAQTNFIVKTEGNAIKLTLQGERFVESLLEQVKR